MQQTEVLKLNLIEGSDPVSPEPINKNMELLEGALADTLQSALAAVGSGGKTCRIACGSYTGTGKVGASTPTSISVGFRPLLVAICHAQRSGPPASFIRGQSFGGSLDSSGLYLTWGDTSVSWYGAYDAASQINVSGVVYYYVVIGDTAD